MKREEIEKVYDQGKEAVVNLVEGLIKEFSEQIKVLTDRIEKLEGQLNKNSHNSSKPPSSDGLSKRKRTRSQRKRSGKKTGGQEGHLGKTLEMTTNPDRVVRLRNKKCTCCGKSLKGVQKKGHDARQVFEIPAPALEVTEYQADITDCPHCGVENRALFPQGVTQKAQYGDYLRSIAVYFRNYQLIPLERNAEIFSDLFNVPLSEGTIVAASSRCADALNGFSEWIVGKITESEVANFDETGINISGSLHWVHTAGTPFLTAYFAHKRRGSEAFDAFSILPGFHGKAVHDHWSAYFKYSCAHVLCNAHHIRELTFVFEHEAQKWGQEMIDCLLKIKESVDKAKEKKKLISSRLMRLYEKRYMDIVQQGLKKNPLQKKETDKKRGRPGKTKVQNLLIRLRDYRHEVLAFMYDVNVPFDNNLAERDLRMIKVQQKVSGLFRTMAGAEQFCKIRSFISTVKKQGFNVIESIYQIMTGNQIYLKFSY